ncbi:unnamed protein product, partial [Arctia plantaginis]
MEYQKRPGTSGIYGQLYETKLLALILFRLQHDRTVEYFYLATNINDVGDFDDICLVVKIEGCDRPVAVFIQVKHKIDDKAVIKIGKKEIVKYVTSFIKITKRFASRPRDDFFDPNLNETDCIFILYTNAKLTITNTESKFENSYATVLNNLLATSDAIGCRAQESDQVVEDFGEYFLKNDLALLAKHFVVFLVDKGNDRSMDIMNDMYVQQYHVILREKVVDVSGIRTDEHELDLKWRTLTFKRDFFSTNDKYVLIFKNHLLKELLKNQREILFVNFQKPILSLDETISLFLNAPSAATLMPLIITYINCNEAGELEFLIKRPSHDVKLLQRTNMSRKEIDEAIVAAETSAMEYLLSLKLKVPVTFGNVDLAIRGSDKKVNRRLKYLATAVCDLCKEYQLHDQYKIVKIEEHLDDGLLKHNGGLASAVGNMLTYDGTTNMMMFSNNFTSEQKIAEQLSLNLNNLIDGIFEYRFVVKTKRFPKLNFDCTDTAREFLNKLIIYETQSNHWKVEEILKEKIQEHLVTDLRDYVMNCSNKGVSVFLHYHDEIRKWWMSPTTGTYLNKTTNLYEQAICNMQAEPLISDLQTTFYISRAKYFKISFTKNAMKFTELPELPSKLFVTTDTVALTTVKVVQCLKSYFLINKFAVLDVEFVLNMPIADFDRLNEEIRMTERVLIIMWHKTQNYGESDYNRLSTFALATEDKQSVVIINSELREIIKKFFRARDVFFHDTETLSNIESQKEILKQAKVVFQGQKVTLDKILDDESVSFVRGVILDTVIRNETINIGEPLSNVQYEKDKDFYVDRSVRRRDKTDYIDDNASSNHKYIANETVFNVNTYFDIPSDVVLLTAAPGMGKSTLLTHVSLNTMKHDDKIWIVRVDLRDYSNEFNEWKECKVVVDALKALNLLCQVVLRNNTISFNIKITGGEAYLVSCIDNKLAHFELSIFLHFYNQRRVIFVFDGFDEIFCYKHKVLRFLSVVKDDLRKCKMWVTSRPYSDILPDLETVLGRSFQLNHLSFTEQEIYLTRFWNQKILLQKPSEEQLKILRTFLDNTRESISKEPNWVRIIYSVFVSTVGPLVFPTMSDAEKDELNKILNFARTLHPRQKDNVVFELSGIPLLLYFLADYFVNIVYCATNRNKAILEFNLHNIYEMFIDNKLKLNLFKDKIKGLTLTIIREPLEKELQDIISIHKKLAAYTFYQDRILQMGLEEFNDMKPLNEQEWYTELNKIKRSSEMISLISHVNAFNELVFINGSLAEYFIAEYVCDIIKSDKFKLFQKVLWYCAISQVRYPAIGDLIERKKEADPELRNAFLEMEKTSPIYKTEYRAYLKRESISQHQYIRILASSINYYEDGCFTEYAEKFKMNDFNKLKNNVKWGLIEYFTNYLVCKMKPQLKQHFGGTPLFYYRGPDSSFVRYFNSVKSMDEIDGILLELKVSRQKRFLPLLMLLTPQDHCGTSQLSNIESMSKNCQKRPTDDIIQTDFVYLLLNPGYPGTLSHTSDPSFSSEIFNFLSTTSTIGNRLHYTEENVQEISEKIIEKELIELARVLETFLEPTIKISKDMSFYEYVERYHVFLRQHVFDVTDIQTDESDSEVKWRTVTFRDEFFDTKDIHIEFLRNCLLEQMLRKKMHFFLKSEFWPNQLISFFFSEPSVATLTLLLGACVVDCEDNKLKFLVERPGSDVEQLRNINIPQSTINEAKLAVRTATVIYLRSLHQREPIDFGNIDLPSQSLNDHSPREVEMNSETLKSAIVKLCEQSTPRKVVTVDDSLDESLLTALANCVGNILICDEETEMLKVQYLDQLTPAQENAKSLYLQLSREIDNLHEYRFHVRTDKIPKCQLDFKNFARDFLRRLIIFAEESIDYEIEKIVFKKFRIGPYIKFYDSFITLNLVRLHIHSQVLKWWKASNSGEYDTKPCDLYQLAAKNVNLEPAISEMHASFYFKNLKYFKYMFNENVTKSKYIELGVGSNLVVVTETVILTTIKVLQSLKSRGFNNEFTVLDLEHMQSTFPNMTDLSLFEELRITTKVLIVVWTQMYDDDILHELSQLFKHKRMVIIANNEFRARVESCGEWLNVVFYNEVESLALIQSHKEIMRDTKVIFQGRNVTLDEIIDDESVTYVKGDVLDKVISNDILHIGKPFSNPQYNELKESLVDSRVSSVLRADDEYQFPIEDKIIRKFHDIVDDVVLVTDPTRIDKSALITHLALKTEEHDGKLWIVRVNFPDHVEQFDRWQDEDTAVDDLESLKFLCQVTMNYKLTSFDVALTKDKAQVVSCVGDAVAAFELNLFVRFYNERRVIFVFDAVDEVGPYCRDKVVTFLTVVSTRLRKSKMWVTCRSTWDEKG